MKKRAFTLIELLVVIAIIAILAAILFPVFAKAKDAAKQAQTISNLKQIGLSTLMYSADYDDTYPMSAYFQGAQGADPRPVVFSIYDAVQPYMKNVQIFLSPADSIKQDWKLRLNGLNLTIPPKGVQLASYAPNLGLFGENLCAIPTPLSKYSQVWSQTALPDVVNTIGFFDAYIVKDLTDISKGPGLTFNKFMGISRYGEMVAINFADGHAKVYRYNAMSSIGSEDGNVARDRPGVPYYNWRDDIPLAKSEGELDAEPNTPVQPYNDLHGIPGTFVGDSEDFPCP